MKQDADAKERINISRTTTRRQKSATKTQKTKKTKKDKKAETK